MSKKETKKTPAAKAVVMKAEEKDFLPAGYKLPKKSDQFMKLTVGQHKIRIMAKPIMGFVFFSERADEQGNKTLRPVRRIESLGDFTSEEIKEQGGKMTNGKLEGSKYFWILLVYCYAEKKFKALELTQISVLDFMIKYYKNEDYGDLRDYDLTIERTGTTKNDTEYTVIPSPPKPLAKEVTEEFAKLSYNLNAILENEYPFS